MSSLRSTLQDFKNMCIYERFNFDHSICAHDQLQYRRCKKRTKIGLTESLAASPIPSTEKPKTPRPSSMSKRTSLKSSRLFFFPIFFYKESELQSPPAKQRLESSQRKSSNKIIIKHFLDIWNRQKKLNLVYPEVSDVVFKHNSEWRWKYGWKWPDFLLRSVMEKEKEVQFLK